MPLSFMSDVTVQRIVESEGLVAQKKKFILGEYYDFVVLNLQDTQFKEIFWRALLNFFGRNPSANYEILINKVCGIRVPGPHQKNAEITIHVYGQDNLIRGQRLAGLLDASLGRQVGVKLQDADKIYEK